MEDAGKGDERRQQRAADGRGEVELAKPAVPVSAFQHGAEQPQEEIVDDEPEQAAFEKDVREELPDLAAEGGVRLQQEVAGHIVRGAGGEDRQDEGRSEEHTSELP